MFGELQHGSGNHVYVAKCYQTGSVEVVALKVGKYSMESSGSSRSVTREAATLMALDGNEWVPDMKFFMKDSVGAYIGTALCGGGDLLSHLESAGTFPVSMARVIVAQLLVAVRSLHGKGFVHRNLKPSSVVFDSSGRLRLVGLSLCHRKGDCVDSDMGSVDYMAPEVIADPGRYTEAVDVWSIGIVLYEMLFGGPPFSDESRERNRTIYRIIHAEKYLWFPESGGISYAAGKDLVKSLLRSATTRLTIDAIVEHPFFEGVDWDNLEPFRIPHEFMRKSQTLGESKMLFRMQRDC